MRRRFLAVAMVLALALPAAAQQAPVADSLPLETGAKIRLTTGTMGEPFFTARLLAIDGDTLLVQSFDRGLDVVALADVTRLDVARDGGRGGRLIGGTLGAVLFILPTTGLVRGMDDEPSAGRRALGIGGAGVVGALLGGWVGGTLDERWEQVLPREPSAR